MARTWRTAAAALIASVTGIGLAVVGGVSPASAAPTELFFSEYIEGSSQQQGARDLQRHRVRRSTSPTAATASRCSSTAPRVPPDDQPHRDGRCRRRLRPRAVGGQRGDPGPGRPDERVGLVQRRRRHHAAQGDDGPRRDRPDRRSTPAREWGTGLTSTADNTLRRKAGIEAGDANGVGRLRPVGAVGRVRERQRRRPRYPPGAGADAAPTSCGLVGTAIDVPVSASDTQRDGASTIAAHDRVPRPTAGRFSRTAFGGPPTADGETATATFTASPSTPVTGSTRSPSPPANDDGLAPDRDVLVTSGSTPVPVCGDPATAIHAIQGSGAETGDQRTGRDDRRRRHRRLPGPGPVPWLLRPGGGRRRGPRSRHVGGHLRLRHQVRRRGR